MLLLISIDIPECLLVTLSPWVVTVSKFGCIVLLLSRGLKAQKDEFIEDKKVNLTRVRIDKPILCLLVTMIIF